jgi:hypothetical protein
MHAIVNLYCADTLLASIHVVDTGDDAELINVAHYKLVMRERAARQDETRMSDITEATISR